MWHSNNSQLINNNKQQQSNNNNNHHHYHQNNNSTPYHHQSSIFSPLFAPITSDPNLTLDCPPSPGDGINSSIFLFPNDLFDRSPSPSSASSIISSASITQSQSTNSSSLFEINTNYNNETNQKFHPPNSNSPEAFLARKIACNFCHHSKVLCDGIRPCQRCVRLNRGDQCVDRKSRVKKHPLLVTNEEPEENSASLSAATNKNKNKPKKRTRKISDNFDDAQSTITLTDNSSSMLLTTIPKSLSNSLTLAFPHPIPMPQSNFIDYNFEDEFIEIDPSNKWISLLSVRDSSPNIYLSRITLLASLRYSRFSHQGHGSLPPFAQFIQFAKMFNLLQPSDITSRIHAHKVLRDEQYINNKSNFSITRKHFNSITNNHNLLNDDEELNQSIILANSIQDLDNRSDLINGHCDGRVCLDSCSGARNHFNENQIKFSFSSSPLIAMNDFEFNNFPLITMKVEANENFDQYKKYMKNKLAGVENNSTTKPNMPVDLPIIIRVNRAFERTFGLEQKAVRSSFIRHSWFALYMEFFARSEWSRLAELELMGEFGSSGGYQTAALCRHQLGAEFPALIDKSFDRDSDVLSSWKMTIIPSKQQSANLSLH